MSLNVKAPTFDAAQTAEHRRVFPDRKCEAEGAGCDGPVIVAVAGEHQLCARHAWQFAEDDHAGRAGRLVAWVSRMKRQGGGQ